MLDIDDLTDFDKNLYNIHLRVSRQRLNQPFKYRKDFSKLDADKSLQLKKLSLFFLRFKHIKPEEFFTAPYSLYTDETYFDLSYYNSLKAVKAYTLYQKKLLTLDPDSNEQLLNIQQSLLFILSFCRENSLALDKYLNHMTGLTPSFLLHLKEHNINIYTLFGFRSFGRDAFQLDSETVRFIIGDDLYNQIDSLRTKLFASKRASMLVTQGLQKIQTKLQQNTCNQP